MKEKQKRKLMFNWGKSRNVKGDNGKFKLDYFGIGIVYHSIFSDCSSFDMYLLLGFWQLNIRWDKNR